MGNEVGERRKFVFCEGLDDVAVVEGLARAIDLKDLNVEHYGGKNRWRDFLHSLPKRVAFGLQ